MFLPNGDHAVVDPAKLRDYCLNAEHPTGKNKARVFASALGFTAEDSGRLQEMLLAAARTDQAVVAGKDRHGQRYTLDFSVFGLAGPVTIRSAWIVDLERTVPRLTSCYVLSE